MQMTSQCISICLQLIDIMTRYGFASTDLHIHTPYEGTRLLIIMEILPENFRSLVYLGIWHEENQRFFLPMWLYRLFVFLVLTYLTAIQAIELLRTSNIIDSTECIFLTLTYVSFYAKWVNITVRRNKFLDLRNRFQTSICQPRCPEEIAILEKAAGNAKWYHLFYLRLALSCGISLVLRPFTKLNEGALELPFKTYHIFDESNPIYFAVIFAIQGIGEVFSTAINSSFDTLCYGFMIMASGQFDLCCYRLISYIESGKIELLKKEWIEHHIYVLDIVDEIESLFVAVTVIFFVTSLFTVCTSVFVMSQMSSGGIEFLLTMVYLVAVFFEVFLYCFHGTNLQQASQRITYAAYESDWTKLTPRTRSILNFMMMLGRKGSIISFRGQCSLCLNTFVWIMKTSYGAFNLLQRVSFE